MAKETLLLFLFCLPIISALDFAMKNGQKQKTWCVAKPSTDGALLAENIKYVCSQVDCKNIIQKGSPCFYPDSLINHASVVMNLYYQNKGRNKWNCNFGNSGLITVTDPSYGNCTYE